MSCSRRGFLKQTILSGAALGLSGALPAFGRFPWATETQPAKRKLRILFLGGTGFLGPHTVRYAVGRGHTLTLFNRGKTNPHLFPELEKLRGDRYEDISALEGHKWDAVIDTLTYVPRVVTEAAELLKNVVKQYVVISSVSVFADFSKPNMGEDAPLATVDPEFVKNCKHHREALQHYGAMKALCEKAAEDVMPGRVTNIRPGLIVGPGDPSDRLTYWMVRGERGGEVLAPGSPTDPLQFVDARDLGAFIVHTIERNLTNTYNAASLPNWITLGRFLDTVRDTTKSDARFTWVDPEFLAEQSVQPWSDMPAWVPSTGDYAGFQLVDTRRAHAAGLNNRPPAETIRDTLKWWHEQPAERTQKMRAGLDAEREKAVLAAWHARTPAGSATGAESGG